MMKKLAVLMTLVCIGLAAVVVKVKIQGDNQGPEITFANTDLVYKKSLTDAELLADVSAVDEVDGDVSSMTVVENAYKISDEEVVVVYVAKDNKNNITKVSRTLPFEEEPEEAESTLPETDYDMADVPEVTPTPAESYGYSESDAETDDSSLDEQSLMNQRANLYDDEKTDLFGETDADRAKKEQEALADDMPLNAPKIYLTDYWIEVPVGTTIDALSYVKEIKDDADDVFELWKKIQLRDSYGNQMSAALSFTAAGTYEYSFLVVDTQSNVSNTATLTVVVQ